MQNRYVPVIFIYLFFLDAVCTDWVGLIGSCRLSGGGCQIPPTPPPTPSARAASQPGTGLEKKTRPVSQTEPNPAHTYLHTLPYSLAVAPERPSLSVLSDSPHCHLLFSLPCPFVSFPVLLQIACTRGTDTETETESNNLTRRRRPQRPHDARQGRTAPEGQGSQGPHRVQDVQVSVPVM